MEVVAIVAAAGLGTRLGRGSKALVQLNGRTLLARAVELFLALDEVTRIVVVGPPERLEAAGAEVKALLPRKSVDVCPGGESRQQSVRAGLLRLAGADYVLVHDAARPLLPDEVIGRLIGALGEGYDGAVPVLPVTDTVKRVRDGVVDETLVRDELVSVQTPQAFAAPALRAALAAGAEGPDCASLVEANGGRIRTVEGDERLLKVTTRADLERVAAWL